MLRQDIDSGTNMKKKKYHENMIYESKYLRKNLVLDYKVLQRRFR